MQCAGTSGARVTCVGETIPELHRMLANVAREAFGGRPTVHRYWDEPEHSHVDVVSAADEHFRRVTSCATIGLCEHDTGLTVDGKTLRVELVGAAYDRF